MLEHTAKKIADGLQQLKTQEIKNAIIFGLLMIKNTTQYKMWQQNTECKLLQLGDGSLNTLAEGEKLNREMDMLR